MTPPPYQRWFNWGNHVWGTSNSSRLTPFPVGWTSTFFGCSSSPSKIKHVAATPRCSTSFLDPCYTNRWICSGDPHTCSSRSPDLVHLHSYRRWYKKNLWYQEQSQTRDEITLTAHRKRRCCHKEHWWKNMQSHTYCPKTILLQRCQCRRSFRIQRHGRKLFTLQATLNMSWI